MVLRWQIVADFLALALAFYALLRWARTAHAMRIALGVGEAGIYPATYDLFGRWVPATERGRAVAIGVVLVFQIGCHGVGSPCSVLILPGG